MINDTIAAPITPLVVSPVISIRISGSDPIMYHYINLI